MIEFIEMIKKMTIVVNKFLGFCHEGHIVEDDEDVGDHLISI